MDSELSALFETTKRLALLAETLKQQTSAAIKEQQDTGQMLSDTVHDVRGNVQQLVQGATYQISRSTRDSVDTALAAATEEHNRILTESANRLRESIREAQQALFEVSVRTRHTVWVSFAAIAGAAVLLVSGGGILLYFQAQAYAEARERTQAAQVDAATMAMYARAGVASCGGHPCLKLDPKSPRWGAKGEYVLLDETPAAKGH